MKKSLEMLKILSINEKCKVNKNIEEEKVIVVTS